MIFETLKVRNSNIFTAKAFHKTHAVNDDWPPHDVRKSKDVQLFERGTFMKEYTYNLKIILIL